MKQQLLRLAAAILLGLPPAAAQAPRLATRTVLTLDAAKFLAKTAEDFGRANNWKLAIAILDDGGNLLYFQRGDGVQIAGIEIAMRKAESALKYQRPGKALAERAVKEPHVIALPGAFPFEGGLPIVHQGAVIGSIGVTGATAQQDAQAAQAALDALDKALRQ